MIRHFSGVATYRTKFNIQPKGRVVLELGRVESVARVIVNGKNLGELWTEPYEMDITSAVVAGENTLELQVANTWRNALIGADKFTKAPPVERADYIKPWTSSKTGLNANTPLQPSGLLGPVQVRIEK